MRSMGESTQSPARATASLARRGTRGSARRRRAVVMQAGRKPARSRRIPRGSRDAAIRRVDQVRTMRAAAPRTTRSTTGTVRPAAPYRLSPCQRICQRTLQNEAVRAVIRIEPGGAKSQVTPDFPGRGDTRGYGHPRTRKPLSLRVPWVQIPLPPQVRRPRSGSFRRPGPSCSKADSPMRGGPGQPGDSEPSEDDDDEDEELDEPVTTGGIPPGL